jgi:hypothetical protein
MTFGTAFVINTLSKSQPDLNKKNQIHSKGFEFELNSSKFRDFNANLDFIHS